MSAVWASFQVHTLLVFTEAIWRVALSPLQGTFAASPQPGGWPAGAGCKCFGAGDVWMGERSQKTCFRQVLVGPRSSCRWVGVMLAINNFIFRGCLAMHFRIETSYRDDFPTGMLIFMIRFARHNFVIVFSMIFRRVSMMRVCASWLACKFVAQSFSRQWRDHWLNRHRSRLRGVCNEIGITHARFPRWECSQS